jgi:hypothetical protein
MTIFMPKTGTSSPTSRNLPRWGYVLLAIICTAMGVWASYVTLEYFRHGAKALESDKEMQALALLAALMFVASEMGAFLIAAMLSERQLRVRRWMLTIFAFCVLGLEVCTIVAVQLALTTGADNHQLDVRQAEIDLRGRIAAIESNAAIARDTAAAQSMAARGLKTANDRSWNLHLANKTLNKASANNAELNQLHGQLAGIMAQKKPTLVGVLGKDNALYYAVARGILISFGGLVFFGTAGALIRMARNGTVSNHAVSESHAQEPVQSSTPATFEQPNAATPKGASRSWNPFNRQNVAAAGIAAGAAGSMGMAHAIPTIAPTAPMQRGQVMDIEGKTVSRDDALKVVAELEKAGLVSKNEDGLYSDKYGRTTGLSFNKNLVTGEITAKEHIQSDIPSISKRIRKTASKPTGKQMDTGTTGKSATRYNRIKAGVLSGYIRPSINAIVNLEGEFVGQSVAREYVEAMEKEGVLVKEGRFWKVAPKPVAVDPNQMDLAV